jgi:hypothetical protein
MRILLAAALCSGCLGSEPQRSSITSGVPTDADPAVVALLQGGEVACTATLVAPRILLTAAHCLSNVATPVALFGAVPAEGGVRIAIERVRVHPNFVHATFDNDIALALLAGDAPAVPVRLPSEMEAGAPLRLVGFGRTGADDVSAPRKREGSALVDTLSERSFTLLAAPSQTCEGDSGGPAFAVESGVIVGVASHGDVNCQSSATHVRVDAYLESFIRPFIVEPGARAALGESCARDEDCEEAMCGPEGACTRRCFGDLPGFCPSGYACLPLPEGGDGCLAEHAGGCSTSGSGGDPFAVFLVLFFLRARRTRAAA